MRDEQYGCEAGQLLVVAELVAAVVVLGRAAGYLDEQRRVGDRVRVDGCDLTRTADDRNIGEG
jgi:hypothetical protein